jgi:hypothetical protein
MSGLVSTMWLAWRSVAVVGVDLEVERESALEGSQLGELILGQRFGREEVKGPSRRPLQDALDDRQVVAKCLAARRGRDDDQVATGADRRIGLRLVRVEAVDAPVAESGGQLRDQVVGQGNGYGRCSREDVIERHVAWERCEIEWRSRGHGERLFEEYRTRVRTSRSDSHR